MALSSVDCAAKAAEFEARAETSPDGRDNFLKLAEQWRKLAREAHFIEQRTFGYQVGGKDDFES